jgi:hypothetical protein
VSVSSVVYGLNLILQHSFFLFVLHHIEGTGFLNLWFLMHCSHNSMLYV